MNFRSGRKNHFAFHVGKHVGICRMPAWVRKTDFSKYFSWTNHIWLHGNLLLCFYNSHHRAFNFVTSINTCGMFILLNGILVNRVFVISNFSIVKTQSLPAVFSLIYMFFNSYVTVLFSTIHWFSLTRSKWLRMVAMGEITSSNVNEVIKTILSQCIFFTKRYCMYKNTHKLKSTNKTKIN